MDSQFDVKKYKAKFEKENYYKPTIRLPKEKKEVIEAVALKTGKSISLLFTEAFEKQYSVDLTIVESKLKDSE